MWAHNEFDYRHLILQPLKHSVCLLTRREPPPLYMAKRNDTKSQAQSQVYTVVLTLMTPSKSTVRCLYNTATLPEFSSALAHHKLYLAVCFQSYSGCSRAQPSSDAHQGRADYTLSDPDCTCSVAWWGSRSLSHVGSLLCPAFAEVPIQFK